MSPRVLIVDDDAATLEAIRGLVSTRLNEVSIDVAASAQSALQSITAMDYDAIVSDIKMPGMDGLKLMQEVLKTRPTTPTLLITGHGDHDLGVHALNAGAYAFIQKPIDRDFFVSWLKRAIQVRQLNRTIEQQNRDLERLVQERTDELEQANKELRRTLEARTQAEEALARSRKFFETIAQATPDMLFVFNIVEGKDVYINRSLEQTLGYTIEDFQNMTGDLTNIFVHPEDLPRVRRWYERFDTAADGEVLDHQHRVRHANGQYRWIYTRATVFERTPQGRAQSILGVSTDITDRKQAEEAVRKSEERYRNLYESIDEGFCIIEVLFDESMKAVDYVFLEINPSFEKQTGIQDARGRSMREIAPHHEEHWFELYGKIALSGESVRFEYPAHELHRWYEGYAYRIGEAQDRKVAIIFNDITERKQAESALELISLLPGENPAPVIRLKEGHVLGFANPAAKRLLAEWGRALGEEAPAEVVQVARAVLDSGDKNHVELAFADHWYAVSVVPVLPGNYVNLYFTDITDRKQAEQDLIESREQLRRALEFDEAVMTNMGEGLYAIDSEGLVSYVNPAAEALLGWRRGELLGRKMHDVIHYKHPDGSSFPAEQCPGLQVLREGKVLKGQTDVFIRKGEEFFPVVYSSSPIRSGDKIVGLVVVFRDV